MRMILASVLLGTLAGVAAAAHLPNLTPAEEACQQAAAKALARFQLVKTKCLVACDRQAAGTQAEADCVAPYAGDTAACVARAEADAEAAIARKCDADCPECYMGGNCEANATFLVSLVEAAVDAGADELRCDDSASKDGLTAGERACRRAVGLQAAMTASRTARCLARCRAMEQRGILAPGSCEADGQTDERTADCLERAVRTCASEPDRRCSDPPECLADHSVACDRPARLAGGFDAFVFCGF